MKWPLKILIGLVSLYLLAWCAVAAYFNYASGHKEVFERHLSRLFESEVSIGELRTHFQGLSPRVQIEQLYVAGEQADFPSFSFESLSAVVSPTSLLRLWPRFTEFAVERPRVEVVSAVDGSLSICGITLSNRKTGINERVLNWLLAQENAVWHDGEVLWRQHGAQDQWYEHISFVYARLTADQRKLRAGVHTRKGPLAFVAQSNGNPFKDKNWDANLEIIGNEGQSLLRPDDLSVDVREGKGRLSLTTLDVSRIRDFILLTGLTADTGWLVNANLSGQLHDVVLDFEGPLLQVENWSFAAAASQISVNSFDQGPSISNLYGGVSITSQGGEFEFSAENTKFEWDKWFAQALDIELANGVLKWRLDELRNIEFSLSDFEFEDQTTRIFNLRADGELLRRDRGLNSVRDLLRVENVVDFGAQVEPEQPTLNLDLSGEYSLNSVVNLERYVPLHPKVDNFRKWVAKAMKGGSLTNGTLSYKGELSRSAVKENRADLLVTGDYTGALVDYAPEQDWPAVSDSFGKAHIKQDVLTILPAQTTVDGESITDATLTINELFTPERSLTLKGKSTLSFAKGVDFILRGPLIKKNQRPETLPIEVIGGDVDVQVEVRVPLHDVSSTSVIGTSRVRNGDLLLPEGVPVKQINTTINFTENEVTSQRVTAQLFGGEFIGDLITIEKAKPPIMKLQGTGRANVALLQPWIGEHMLSMIEGQTDWSGSLLIDGPRLDIQLETALEGVAVNAPEPLLKAKEAPRELVFAMTTGGEDVEQAMEIRYGDHMMAQFAESRISPLKSDTPSFFDRSLVQINTVQKGVSANEFVPIQELRPGVNFSVQGVALNLDNWLETVIDLAQFEPTLASDNTDFLDAMRSIEISSPSTEFLSRPFGALQINATSERGWFWQGSLEGENVAGLLKLKPREDNGIYELTLARLNIPSEADLQLPVEPIDYSLDPLDYPELIFDIDKFSTDGKTLGKVALRGKVNEDRWQLDSLSLEHNGIRTSANGAWTNTQGGGSISAYEFDTKIMAVEDALNEMDFDGIIRQGEGSMRGLIKWVGAPHEFDYARLAGDFEIFVKDGELVQVEPGGGKLLGLLNINSILRRLVLDFKDVFAQGLVFDRMRFSGVLSEGEAILQDAYIVSPAAFVRMEGKVDLDQEMIDMEMHVSPELGGNLALLSALANPAAGALVYLTQQVFKDEMRESSFISYRALGSWDEFELVEIKDDVDPITQSSAN